MCTRIFNSQNKEFPVTGRNMDWYWQLNSGLYAFPAGLERQGVDKILQIQSMVKTIPAF